MRLVEIVWNDTVSVAEWGEAEAVKEWTACDVDHRCRTVGLLVQDESALLDYVVVAACWTPDLKQFNLVQRIPRGTIKSIVPLGFREASTES